MIVTVLLKNVKICPLHNPNFIVSNKDELVDLLPSVPIVSYVDYVDGIGFDYLNMKLIGIIAPRSSMNIVDGYITSDIYIEEEYKDYVFKNYQCTIKNISSKDRIFRIDRFDCIEFGK